MAEDTNNKNEMTLQELNFQHLIEYDVNDVKSYSFDKYCSNNSRHPRAIDYCTSCEELKCNVSPKDASFKLCNISHGAHSRDFINAVDSNMDISKWHTSGVVFVMESPSRDYGIYETTEITKKGQLYNKRPSKQWYWVHNKCDYVEYPIHFKGRKYGELVRSVIFTFKLANAYLTNLIKCGMNDSSGDIFKGLVYFDPKCIQNCYNLYLSKEIELMNPKVIFTFGTNVYNQLSCRLKDSSIKLVGLPHPAGQRSGFKDEYYNVLYFCMIAKWLCRTGVIEPKFYTELMKIFMEK